MFEPPPSIYIHEVNNIIVPEIICHCNCTSIERDKYLEENPFIFLSSMIKSNILLEEIDPNVKLFHVVQHPSNNETDMAVDSQVLHKVLPKIVYDHGEDWANRLWAAAFPNLINFKVNGYTFSKYLTTDGYAVSLVFYDEEHYIYGRKPKEKKSDIATRKNIFDRRLADVEFESAEHQFLLSSNVVAIDPGCRDLMFCVNSGGKRRKQLRLSRAQRKKELGTAYRVRTVRDMKLGYSNAFLYWEDELSECNSKSMVASQNDRWIEYKCKFFRRTSNFFRRQKLKKIYFRAYVKVSIRVYILHPSIM